MPTWQLSKDSISSLLVQKKKKHNKKTTFNNTTKSQQQSHNNNNNNNNNTWVCMYSKNTLEVIYRLLGEIAGLVKDELQERTRRLHFLFL